MNMNSNQILLHHPSLFECSKENGGAETTGSLSELIQTIRELGSFNTTAQKLVRQLIASRRLETDGCNSHSPPLTAHELEFMLDTFSYIIGPGLKPLMYLACLEVLEDVIKNLENVLNSHYQAVIRYNCRLLFAFILEKSSSQQEFDKSMVLLKRLINKCGVKHVVESTTKSLQLYHLAILKSEDISPTLELLVSINDSDFWISLSASQSVDDLMLHILKRVYRDIASNKITSNKLVFNLLELMFNESILSIKVVTSVVMFLCLYVNDDSRNAWNVMAMMLASQWYWECSLQSLLMIILNELDFAIYDVHDIIKSHVLRGAVFLSSMSMWGSSSIPELRPYWISVLSAFHRCIKLQFRVQVVMEVIVSLQRLIKKYGETLTTEWIKILEVVEIVFLTTQRLEEGEWSGRLISAVSSTISSIHSIVMDGKYCGNEDEFNSLVLMTKHILATDVKVKLLQRLSLIMAPYDYKWLESISEIIHSYLDPFGNEDSDLVRLETLNLVENIYAFISHMYVENIEVFTQEVIWPNLEGLLNVKSSAIRLKAVKLSNPIYHALSFSPIPSQLILLNLLDISMTASYEDVKCEAAATALEILSLNIYSMGDSQILHILRIITQMLLPETGCPGLVICKLLDFISRIWINDNGNICIESALSKVPNLISKACYSSNAAYLQLMNRAVVGINNECYHFNMRKVTSLNNQDIITATAIQALVDALVACFIHSSKTLRIGINAVAAAHGLQPLSSFIGHGSNEPVAVNLSSLSGGYQSYKNPNPSTGTKTGTTPPSSSSHEDLFSQSYPLRVDIACLLCLLTFLHSRNILQKVELSKLLMSAVDIADCLTGKLAKLRVNSCQKVGSNISLGQSIVSSAGYISPVLLTQITRSRSMSFDSKDSTYSRDESIAAEYASDDDNSSNDSSSDEDSGPMNKIFDHQTTNYTVQDRSSLDLYSTIGLGGKFDRDKNSYNTLSILNASIHSDDVGTVTGSMSLQDPLNVSRHSKAMTDPLNVSNHSIFGLIDQGSINDNETTNVLPDSTFDKVESIQSQLLTDLISDAWLESSELFDWAVRQEGLGIVILDGKCFLNEFKLVMEVIRIISSSAAYSFGSRGDQISSTSKEKFSGLIQSWCSNESDSPTGVTTWKKSNQSLVAATWETIMSTVFQKILLGDPNRDWSTQSCINICSRVLAKLRIAYGYGFSTGSDSSKPSIAVGFLSSDGLAVDSLLATCSSVVWILLVVTTSKLSSGSNTQYHSATDIKPEEIILEATKLIYELLAVHQHILDHGCSAIRSPTTSSSSLSNADNDNNGKIGGSISSTFCSSSSSITVSEYLIQESIMMLIRCPSVIKSDVSKLFHASIIVFPALDRYKYFLVEDERDLKLSYVQPLFVSSDSMDRTINPTFRFVARYRDDLDMELSSQKAGRLSINKEYHWASSNATIYSLLIVDSQQETSDELKSIACQSLPVYLSHRTAYGKSVLKTNVPVMNNDNRLARDDLFYRDLSRKIAGRLICRSSSYQDPLVAINHDSAISDLDLLDKTPIQDFVVINMEIAATTVLLNSRVYDAISTPKSVVYSVDPSIHSINPHVVKIEDSRYHLLTTAPRHFSAFASSLGAISNFSEISDICHQDFASSTRLISVAKESASFQQLVFLHPEREVNLSEQQCRSEVWDLSSSDSMRNNSIHRKIKIIYFEGPCAELEMFDDIRLTGSSSGDQDTPGDFEWIIISVQLTPQGNNCSEGDPTSLFAKMTVRINPLAPINLRIFQSSKILQFDSLADTVVSICQSAATMIRGILGDNEMESLATYDPIMNFNSTCNLRRREDLIRKIVSGDKPTYLRKKTSDD